MELVNNISRKIESGVVVVESDKTLAPGQMSNGVWWVRP